MSLQKLNGISHVGSFKFIAVCSVQCVVKKQFYHSTTFIHLPLNYDSQAWKDTHTHNPHP